MKNLECFGQGNFFSVRFLYAENPQGKKDLSRDIKDSIKAGESDVPMSELWLNDTNQFNANAKLDAALRAIEKMREETKDPKKLDALARGIQDAVRDPYVWLGLAGIGGKNVIYPWLKKAAKTPEQRLKVVTDRLEKSDIANDLKTLMTAWMVHNLPGELLQAFDEEAAAKMTIDQLLKDMGSVYLGKNPDVNTKPEKDPSQMPAFLADGMFDALFQFALSDEYAPAGSPERKNANRVFARFKAILHSGK